MFFSSSLFHVGSLKLVRRLGYLSDTMGLDKGRTLPRPESHNYLFLDRTMPAVGRKNPAWRLVINTDCDGWRIRMIPAREIKEMARESGVPV